MFSQRRCLFCPILGNADHVALSLRFLSLSLSHSHRPHLTGWEILVQEEEEQRGGKAISWRAAPKGEPDHGACLLPGAGKRGAATASGRAAEGLRPLPEHPGSLRGQVRPYVKKWERVSTRQKQNSLPHRNFNIDTNTKGFSYCTSVSADPGHCVLGSSFGLFRRNTGVLDTHTGRQWGMMGAIGHRKACGERLATAPGEGERMIVGPLHEHTHKECTGRLKGKKQEREQWFNRIITFLLHNLTDSFPSLR